MVAGGRARRCQGDGLQAQNAHAAAVVPEAGEGFGGAQRRPLQPVVIRPNLGVSPAKLVMFLLEPLSPLVYGILNGPDSLLRLLNPVTASFAKIVVPSFPILVL